MFSRCVFVPLTQIVTEPSHLHAQNVLISDLKFWLPELQGLKQLSCQVTHSVPTHTHTQAHASVQYVPKFHRSIKFLKANIGQTIGNYKLGI